MDNPLFYLALGILLAWVISYFYSYQVNRRKLNWLAHWLESALPMLGSQINSRWKGSNTLTITLERGRGIIRETAIVLGAQPKVIFALLVSMLRGGRDSFSIIIAISPPPRAGLEFEIFEAKAPIPQSVLLSAQTDWKIEDYPRAFYKVASRDEAARDIAFRLIALLNDDNYSIRRIAVRPTTPHLMFVFNITRLPKGRAEDLVQLIRNLAEEVAPRPPAPSENESRPPLRRAKERQTPEPRAKSNIQPGILPNGHRSLNGHKKLDDE